MPQKKQKPMIILVAGGTAAGKSTLANKVPRFFSDKRCTVIGLDDYTSVKLSDGTPWISLSLEERAKIEKVDINAVTKIEYDWFKPESVSWQKLLVDLEKAKQNSDVVIIEGTNVLQNEELKEMADLKFYSHTDSDIRLILKIQRSPWYKKLIGEEPRDPRDFGGGKLPFIFKAWWRGAKVTEEKYVIPTQKYADLIISYNEMEDLPKNTELLYCLVNLYFNDPELYHQKLAELKNQGKGGEKERVFDPLLEPSRQKNKFNSTYELIKQISQKKGRKIKVVADWDDCLQPVKVMAVYAEANPKLNIPFKQFFDNYWENATVGPGGTLGRDNFGDEVFAYLGNEEEKKAAENFEQKRAERRANKKLFINSFYDSKERFEAPFTSTAEEIVQALKEDLISELVINTAFREDPNEEPEVQEFLAREVRMKKEKINRVFGQFPQFRLEYTKVETFMGRGKPHRWEIIQKNHPDFDLMVNDSPSQITSVWERLGKDKYYAVNDFLHTRYLQAPDIYHVKTTLSDIRDENIIQAAEEYRKKNGYPTWQEEQKQKPERERERERAKVYWMVGGGIIVLILIGILLVMFQRKRRHK